MKYISSVILVSLSLLFFSCSKSESPVSSSEYSDPLSNPSTIPSVVPLNNSFEISQTINGIKGGSIIFDTTFVNAEGDTIDFEINLTFLPNSFTGLKVISVVPDFDSSSVSFLPSMTFDKPAFLDLSFEGVDLAKLGFQSNDKTDFVYINDNGEVEYILNNECKINWSKSLIYVRNAKLPHFSRYAFIKRFDQ